MPIAVALTLWLALASLVPSIAMAAPKTAGMPSGQAAIRVVAQDSRIRFGQAVDLTLRVESDADITSIQTFYRPRGTRTITTYGYADFSPGREVTAHMTIPTASPTYYPPGVVFEVRYEVSDAAGNRIETEPLAIEYLDPGFDWRRLSRKNLTVIYHDRSEGSINSLLAEVSGRIPRIESTVGAEQGGVYRAVLFNSNAEARRAFPFVSQAATEGHVFAGFAYEQYGLFVLDHAGTPGVTHELTHLIFGRATNAPTAKRPAWLNEGLAVYFETGSRSATAAQLRGAIRNDTLLPLRAMNSIPGRPDQIDVFYPESGNLVGFLIERHGEGRMRALVEGMRRGALPGEAVLAAYGVTLEELENEWRRDVGARIPPPLPTATPATSAPGGVATPAGPGGGGSGAQGAATPAQVQSTPTPVAAAETPAPAGSPVIVEPATSPPPFTIWWLIAGLFIAAAVFAGIYFVRKTRQGP